MASCDEHYRLLWEEIPWTSVEQLKSGKPRWILLEIRGVTHKRVHGVNSDTSVSRQLMGSMLSVLLGMKGNICIAISPILPPAAFSKRMAPRLNLGCSVSEKSYYERVYGTALARGVAVRLLWQFLEEIGPMLSSFNLLLCTRIKPKSRNRIVQWRVQWKSSVCWALKLLFKKWKVRKLFWGWKILLTLICLTSLTYSFLFKKLELRLLF